MHIADLHAPTMADLSSLPPVVMRDLISRLSSREHAALRLVSRAVCHNTEQHITCLDFLLGSFMLPSILLKLPGLQHLTISGIPWEETRKDTFITQELRQLSPQAGALPSAVGALTSLTHITLTTAAAQDLASLRSSMGLLAAAPNLQQLTLKEPDASCRCYGRLYTRTSSNCAWLWMQPCAWADKLTSLHLQGVPVPQKLPLITPHLTRLQRLCITGRQLRSADVEQLLQLGNCRQLTALLLLDSPMTFTPEKGWQNVGGLKLLDLSHNQLTRLAPGLSSLTALTALHCSHNSLSTLPHELSVLSRLQHLCASHNYLSGAGACLPALLPHFPQLTALELDNVSDKHGELVLPAQLEACSCLRDLSIKDNYAVDWQSVLTVLPTCKALQVLKVSKVPAEVLTELQAVVPAALAVVHE